MIASSLKPQASMKPQILNSIPRPTPHFCYLELGASLELGAWRLKLRRLLFLLAAFLLAAPAVHAASSEKRAASSWEHSIVTIEVARKQYDYYQPWTRQMRRLQKVGTVVGEH